MSDPATPDPDPIVSPVPNQPEYDRLVAALPVRCVYCQAAILADAFAAWFPSTRSLFARCPECHRRMVVPATTWLGWSGLPSPVTS